MTKTKKPYLPKGMDEAERYDWEAALETSTTAEARPLGRLLQRLTLLDIAEVVKSEVGEGDGRPWVGLFLLTDGTYASVDAWCDYTGWDCRSGGDVRIGTKAQVLKYGLTTEQRRLLGLTLKS